MKKRLLLTLITLSMSLAGCDFLNLFKKKDNEEQTPQDNTPAEVDDLTPAQREQATKTTTYLTDLVTESVGEEAAKAMATYLVQYSEEFAKKDCDVDKVKGYVDTIKESDWKNGFADYLSFFGEIGADEGLDDSVYFAYAYGKALLRASADDETDQGKLYASAIAFVEKEGETLPDNALDVVDQLYKVYVKGVTVVPLKVLPFVTKIMQEGQPTGSEAKTAFEAIGGLIDEVASMEASVTYLANFSQRFALDLVPQIPGASEYNEIIVPIIQFLDMNEIINNTFDAVSKLGTTLKSMPAAYYEHIDATESPVECYAYMALELVNSLYSKYDIPSEELATAFDELVGLLKSIYSAVNEVYTGIEINAIHSNVQQQLNQFNNCLSYYWDEEPLSTIDDVLEWFEDVMGFDPYEGVDPLMENSDFFWDKAHNTIVYAQKESADGEYVGLYPEVYKGVVKTDEWFSLNTYAPENLELTYSYGIPSYVEEIINSQNLKPIFESLVDLGKTISSLRLESLSSESLARAIAAYSTFNNLKAEYYDTFSYVVDNEEKFDQVLLDKLPLDEYKDAVENTTYLNENGYYSFMTEPVTEDGVTSFKVYDISYSIDVDEYGSDKSCVEYTISDVSYGNIQPVADLIYAVLSELASGKVEITDKVIDGLCDLYVTAKPLFDEIKSDLPLKKDDLAEIEGYIEIADKFFDGEDKPLLKTLVNDLFVALKGLFSAFIPGDSTPAAIDFSSFVVETIAYKLPLEDIIQKFSAEQLKPIETLLNTVYTCLVEADMLAVAIDFLPMFERFIECNPQPEETEFSENPGMYYVYDAELEVYILAEEYSSEETYYVEKTYSQKEFVDTLFGLVTMFLQAPAA